MVFSIRNRVNFGSSPLFYSSHYGDVDLVARVLRDEPYRLNDVVIEDGRTPLLAAIHAGQVGVARLLLQAGADPYQQLDNGESVLVFCAKSALTRRNNLTPEMSRLLRVQEFLQEADIPEITKAILHLPNCRKVEDLIRTARSKSLVEALRTDDLGFTTLHWACAFGDHEAVRMLLALGADANAKSTVTSYTPLHCAAKAESGGVACITLLCEAGAQLNSNVDAGGGTPLHHAGAYGRAETVAALVANGAPLEARTYQSGYTVLHALTQGDSVAIMDWLLDHHYIDIDIQSVSDLYPGITPFNVAMSYNSHMCVQSLLRRGADFRHRFSTSGDIWTVLHLAADRADIRMLRILADHGLAGVDIHATRHGRTAQDMFDARKGKSDELIAAFGDLLAAMEQAMARPTRGQSGGEQAVDGEESHDADHADSGDEVFYDALE